jgi:L-alanine-DL-glutamate epimerase-like enolase superfamily enzyme
MQITKAKVIPVELTMRQAVQMAHLPPIDHVIAIFVRIETLDGRNAWGCAVAHPDLTGENPEDVIQTCLRCADLVPDLHPTNLEYSLAQLAPLTADSPSASCAFDLAFHDLLGLASGIPLYRLLGGYRNRIQTSATIPVSSVEESVTWAEKRVSDGFHLLKIKGGLDPDEDVQRVKAIHRAFPKHILRLDLDGSYTVQQSLDIARVLEGQIEMLEQPTPSEDIAGLRQVMLHSPIPVLADQSVSGPSSALELGAQKAADGLSVKIATCGGIRCARQIDAISRAARIATMVSCVIEPALLIAAGLSFALSSPNVRYGDLDGHLDLVNDPTLPGFRLEEGWLVASEMPGLGCSIDLG